MEKEKSVEMRFCFVPYTGDCCNAAQLSPCIGWPTGSCSSQTYKGSLWMKQKRASRCSSALLVHYLPALLAPYWPLVLPSSLLACGLLWIFCLWAQIWFQCMSLLSWSSPCLVLTSVCLVFSSSSRTLTCNFWGVSLPSPLVLCTFCLQPNTGFPSPDFPPREGPSADSSSNHTLWAATSGWALIPTVD